VLKEDIGKGTYPIKFNTKVFDSLEAIKYINEIDPHMPFSSERCREIVDMVSPDYLTHEFIAKDYEELKYNVSRQCNALHGPGKKV
jgi:hypothetical protein